MTQRDHNPKPPYRFARMPLEVLQDDELTRTDLRVYGTMAVQCFHTNLFTLGQRKLAQMCGLDRRNLCRCLEKLGSRGHISRAIGRLVNRTVFQLNSPVFLAEFDPKMASPVTPNMASSQTPRYRYRKRALPRSETVH